MNFSQVWDVVVRQWIAVALMLVLGLLALSFYQFGIRDTFSGTAQVLLVTQPGAHDSTVGIGDLPTVATSTVVLERVRSALGLTIPLTELKSRLSARVVQRSSIMDIAYRDADRTRAADVPNSVADNLSQYYGEISSESYSANVKNLTAALGLQAKKIAALNKRLSMAVGSDPFVVSERSADDITQRLTALETSRALAEADVAANNALADTTAPSPEISKTARHEILQGDPRLRVLSESAAKDYAQLATDRAGYTDRFPGLAGEVTKVSREQATVSQEAKRALADPNRFSPSESNTIATHSRQLATVAGAQARVDKLDKLIVDEQKRLSDISGTGLAVSTLRAQRDVAQTDYNALSARRAAAVGNRAEAFSLGSVKVLDRAISADTQRGSQRPMIVFVVSVLLIALAIGAAFLVDSLDPRLRRSEQIEALYGRPVIADLGSR